MRIWSRSGWGAVAVVGAIALTASTAGARPVGSLHSYVVAGNVIGGFRTATDGYTRARRLFGGPYSSTQNRYVCIVRWPGGLVVTFRRKLPYAAFAKACVVVESAKIAGTRWHTDKGLRVGSAAAQIRRAYPNAVERKIAGVTMWVLVPGLDPALAARAEGGKIRYLSVLRL
jgi:hypothetical protein